METRAPIPSEALLEHAAFIRALARRLLDRDEADDVVQDTMLAALRRPPRDRSRLRQWLGAVARRLALQRRRAAGRRARRERKGARPGPLPAPDDVAAQLEVQRRVVDAVLALDEPYRSTVVHRFFHDRSVREIAVALGVPRKTVESRLTRALRRLRGRLDRDYEGDRRSWCAALLPLALPNAAAAATTLGAIVLGAKAKGGLAAAAVVVAGAGVWTVRHVDRAPPAAPKRGVAREAHAGPAPPAQPGAADPVARVRAARARARRESPAEDHAEQWAGGVLEVVVATETGAPVPKGSRVIGEGTERVETTVGSDGACELRDLKEGGYRIIVVAPGYAPSWTGHHMAVSRDHPRNRVSVRLTHGSVVRVHAAPGMTLTLEGGVKARPPGRTVADRFGRAEWTLLTHGWYGLRFDLDGAERAWRFAIGEREGPIDLTIAVGTVVNGTVHDGNGRPVADADVLLAGERVRTWVKTDERGRFAAPGLPPAAYNVTVRGRGFAAHGGAVTVEGRAVTGHAVVFGPPSVAGTVKGGARDTTTVRLGSVSAPVDGEGRYVFWNVPAGTHVLTAWPGRSDYTRPEREVEIRAGESLAGINFEVGPVRYGSLEMEIRNPDGTMPENIQAYVGTKRISTSMVPERIAPGRFRLRLTTGSKRINLANRATFDVEIVENRTLFRSIQLRR